ncbi:SIMPL domain-containing protein [Comamonas sp. lk]|uniref:SIMPL domain-containing protein n=1 Tax=Comamonas sp. lk TaxID=2201272 RepID=UPI000EB0766A|nr:SIMPL domain-containing protein [Comamonas sp. lk]
MNKYSWTDSRRRTAAGVLLLSALCSGGTVLAQGTTAVQPAARPMNVLNLQAQGVVEVKQDWLTATLSATKEGRDAAAVQSQLQKAVEAAMTVLRRDAQAGQLDLSSGNFSVSPRYGNNGKMDGWQGRAEIVLQGRDFVRITQAAAKVPEMTLASMGFGLSREAREKVEGEAQAKAIEAFRQRAASISKSFGFAGYSLGEITVNSGEGMTRPPYPRMMAMSKAGYADAAPVPVEADKAEVTVSVSGSVQMH